MDDFTDRLDEELDKTFSITPVDGEASLAPADGPASSQQQMGLLGTLQSTFVLTLTGGRRSVPNVMGKAMMVRLENGLVYFQPDRDVLYDVVEVRWDGPLYQLRTMTDAVSQSKTKSGRRGRLLGAVVGSVLAPGVGTIVGAAVGTGGKSKTKGMAHSETYQEQVEVPAPCRIVLERMDTHAEVTITTDLMSDKAPDYLGLVQDFGGPAYDDAPQASVQAIPESVQTADPYEELKKAKELLDLGILTQAEFDAKKTELLNL